MANQIIKQPLDEKDSAVLIANRILDKSNVDPDSDECILARQLLRALDRELAQRIKPAECATLKFK